MKIMVCNIGSSSFKFQLLDMTTETQLARGYSERVGSKDAAITYSIGDNIVLQETAPLPSQREAVQHALDFLTRPDHAVLNELGDLDGIGFKTIQAGEKNGSVLLTDDVLRAMEDYKELAPAHNPPYLTAIYMFREMCPQIPLVGVFEPGFHLNVPDYARVYGTPWEWIEKYNVVQYGYHGASHRSVTHKTVEVLNLPPDDHKIITCHLGGSSSLCAFKNGVSIDVSMGFTPQTGLIQGTRVGDIDAFVLPYIMDKKGITLDEALTELSKNSGLKGLSGISADMRDINEAIDKGNERARLARDKFVYDIKRYVGAYIILMQGIDAITFTGGIGQHDASLRKDVLNSLGFMGLKFDEQKNEHHQTRITTADSAITGLVLETNEEIVVARETVNVINEMP